MKDNFEALLNALTKQMSPSEIVLSGIKADIAACITSARLEKGLSQKAFAEYMSVSQGLVSRWESGETNFTIQTLVDIAQKLDIPIASPFVSQKRQHYTASHKENITQFPKDKIWSSVSNCTTQYSNDSANEIKEM